MTVTGVLGERGGVVYYAIAGSQTGVPAHEVDFFEEEAAHSGESQEVAHAHAHE